MSLFTLSLLGTETEIQQDGEMHMTSQTGHRLCQCRIAALWCSGLFQGQRERQLTQMGKIGDGGQDPGKKQGGRQAQVETSQPLSPSFYRAWLNHPAGTQKERQEYRRRVSTAQMEKHYTLRVQSWAGVNNNEGAGRAFLQGSARPSISAMIPTTMRLVQMPSAKSWLTS